MGPILRESAPLFQLPAVQLVGLALAQSGCAPAMSCSPAAGAPSPKKRSRRLSDVASSAEAERHGWAVAAAAADAADIGDAIAAIDDACTRVAEAVGAPGCGCGLAGLRVRPARTAAAPAPTCSAAAASSPSSSAAVGAVAAAPEAAAAAEFITCGCGVKFRSGGVPSAPSPQWMGEPSEAACFDCGVVGCIGGMACVPQCPEQQRLAAAASAVSCQQYYGYCCHVPCARTAVNYAPAGSRASRLRFGEGCSLGTVPAAVPSLRTAAERCQGLGPRCRGCGVCCGVCRCDELEQRVYELQADRDDDGHGWHMPASPEYDSGSSPGHEDWVDCACR